MSSPTNHSADTSRNPTVRAVSVARRRKALRAVLRLEPVSEETLAAHLAARVRGTPPSAMDEGPAADEGMRSTHTELVHRHLPSLAAAGLVAWDRESGTVESTTHPALSDRRFACLLDLDAAGVDDALDALSHEHRRIVLTALWEGEAEQSVPALARKIARHDREGTPAFSVDDVGIALHHAHLPLLADYDLVDYDRQSSRVTYAGHPALETVLSTIYEPDDSLVEKFDGLLSGLRESYRAADPDASRPAGWPHHWRHPHE